MWTIWFFQISFSFALNLSNGLFHLFFLSYKWYQKFYDLLLYLLQIRQKKFPD